MYLTLVGGQLDGELVVIVSQHQLIQLVQCLLKDHTTFVFLANAHLLSEEFQTTEDRTLVIIDVRNQFGVDDIDTAQSSYEDQTVMRTTHRALVVRSLLQAVLVAEAAHQERPLTVLLLLRHDVRDSVLRHHPHCVEVVLNDTHDTRSKEAAVHIEQLLTFGLGIKDAASCRRPLPDQLTTVFHHTDRIGYCHRLSRHSGNGEIHHLTTHGVDQRIVVRMTYQQPALLGPRG